MKRRLLFCLIAALAVLTALPAVAQDFRTYAQHSERLSREFGEIPRCQGLTRGGALIEMFAGGKKAASWTLLRVLPNGVAWPVDAGDYWVVLPATETEDPDS